MTIEKRIERLEQAVDPKPGFIIRWPAEYDPDALQPTHTEDGVPVIYFTPEMVGVL
jgi:hypothetical protein